MWIPHLNSQCVHCCSQNAPITTQSGAGHSSSSNHLASGFAALSEHSRSFCRLPGTVWCGFLLRCSCCLCQPSPSFSWTQQCLPLASWVVFFWGGGRGGQAEQFILFHRITASSHLSDALWEQAPLLPHPSLYLTSATLPRGLLWVFFFIFFSLCTHSCLYCYGSMLVSLLRTASRSAYSQKRFTKVLLNLWMHEQREDRAARTDLCRPPAFGEVQAATESVVWEKSATKVENRNWRMAKDFIS